MSRLLLIFGVALAGCSFSPAPLPSSPTPSTPDTLASVPPPAGAKVILPGPNWQKQAMEEIKAHGVAYLGAGNFTTPSWVLADKMHLVGAGPDHTRIVSPGSRAVFTVVQDTRLEHLTITHEGGKAADLVRAAACRLSLDDCRLTGSTQDALRVFDKCRGEFKNCEFVDNAACGVEQEAGTSVTATNCAFSGHGGISWSSDGACNTQISGCSFSQSRYPGTWLSGRGTKLVNNCTYRDCQEEGVSVSKGTVATVANCSFVNVRVNGIGVHGRPKLLNNSISGSMTGIMYVDDAAGEATNNTCTDCQLNGIEVGGTAHPRLQGNHCARNLQAGISYFERAAGVATDNLLEDNPRGGIIIEAPARPEIGKNRFQGNLAGEVVHAP